MKKVIAALSGLGVFLALGLLVIGLFWLVMRVPGWLFDMPGSVHV